MTVKQPNTKYRVVSQPKPLEPLSLEWAVFRFLEEWTAEDVQIAINKNIEVDLSAYVNTLEDRVVQEVTKTFKTHRPDLQKVLASKEGEKWVRWNIRNAMNKMMQKKTQT